MKKPQPTIETVIDRFGKIKRIQVAPSLNKRKAWNQQQRAQGVKPALRQALPRAPLGGFSLRELNDEVRAELALREQLKKRA